MLTSLSFLGLVALVILYWIYKNFWQPFQVFKKLGVNGPRPEPFFGNSRLRQKIGLLKFISYLQQEYGPISGFYFGRNPHLLVFDLEILKHVLVKEFNAFMDRPPFPDLKNSPQGLGMSRGKVWKVTRQILSPTFSAAKMKSMVPLIEKGVDGLIKKMGEISDSGRSVDIFKVFGLFTMETIVATAFGKATDIQGGENDELINAANLIFRGAEERKKTFLAYLVPILSNFPWLESIIRYLSSRSIRGKAMATLQETALALIRERRKNGYKGKYKDLLQLMMDASVQEEEGEESCLVSDQKLTNEQIVSHCITVLLTGYETIANTLSSTAYLLALNPDIQERLQSEIDNYMEANPDMGVYETSQEIAYLDMVLSESLRLYPPGVKTRRYCQKTVTVNGLTIPEGVTVMVPIAHLHKDPQYWEEPEKFNPERFAPEEKAKRPQLCYMPFGHGPRNCMGMRFAILEAKLALIQMLRKFTFVRASDTEVPLETVVGITMVPKNGIFIKVVSRD